MLLLMVRNVAPNRTLVIVLCAEQSVPNQTPPGPPAMMARDVRAAFSDADRLDALDRDPRVDDRRVRVHEELAREEAQHVEALRREMHARDEVARGAVALHPRRAPPAQLGERLRTAAPHDERRVVGGRPAARRDREDAGGPARLELDGRDGRQPREAYLTVQDRGGQLGVARRHQGREAQAAGRGGQGAELLERGLAMSPVVRPDHAKAPGLRHEGSLALP